MRISDDEQTYKDFDWYCVDGQGQLGHFASAGFKKVPPSVATSAEDLRFLTEAPRMFLLPPAPPLRNRYLNTYTTRMSGIARPKAMGARRLPL